MARPVTGESGSIDSRAGAAERDLPPQFLGPREPDLPEPVTAPAYAARSAEGSYPLADSYPATGEYPEVGSYQPGRASAGGSYSPAGPYPPGSGPVPPEEPPGGLHRPRLRLLAIAIPVFLVVTIGVVAFLSDRGSGEQPIDRTAVPGGGGEVPAFVVPTDPRNVSAPLDGLEEASFDLLTGTNAVNVQVVDLADELFRISTPARGKTLPRANVADDRVQLQLVPSGEDGPDSVDVQLNSRVRWQVRMTGGAAEHRLDLGEADLAGVELLGGATRVELILPPPDGTLTVRMTGGVNDFVVDVPQGPPTRVRAGKGAASVTIDGNRNSGIAAGTVLRSPGWNDATDRYDIDMVAGVATLNVRQR